MRKHKHIKNQKLERHSKPNNVSCKLCSLHTCLELLFHLLLIWFVYCWLLRIKRLHFLSAFTCFTIFMLTKSLVYNCYLSLKGSLSVQNVSCFTLCTVILITCPSAPLVVVIFVDSLHLYCYSFVALLMVIFWLTHFPHQSWHTSALFSLLNRCFNFVTSCVLGCPSTPKW